MRMNRKFLIMVLFSAYGVSAVPDEKAPQKNLLKPCLMNLKGVEKAQWISSEGQVQIGMRAQQDLPCQATLMSQSEVLVFRNSFPIQFRMAAQSFLEVGKEISDGVFLSKGILFLSANQLDRVWKIKTPGSLVEFTGGSILIEVESLTQKTVVTVLEGSSWVSHRMLPDARVQLKTAERTEVQSQAKRIVPSEPIIVTENSVSGVLSRLAVPKDQKDEILAEVRSEIKNREVTFMTGFESWAKMKVKDRKPSSIESSEEVVDAVDERELEFTLEMMNRRLKGQGYEDLVQERSPASIRTSTEDSDQVLADPEDLKQKNMKKKEVDKILRKIEVH